MFNKAIRVAAGVVIAWNVYGIFKCCEEVREIREKVTTMYKKYR